MKNQFEAILFDLDGTLLDTAADLANAVNQVLIEHGKKPLAFSKLRPVASHGSIGLLGIGFGISPKDTAFNDLKNKFLQNYEANIHLETKLFDGMQLVLEKLNAIQLPWAIVTNKPRYLAKKLIEKFPELNQHQILVAADEKLKNKPAPDGLLFACQTMQVNPEKCLYIGDAIIDIEAAKAAKMQSMVALYGYIPIDIDPFNWPADYFIQAPSEILTLV